MLINSLFSLLKSLFADTPTIKVDEDILTLDWPGKKLITDPNEMDLFEKLKSLKVDSKEYILLTNGDLFIQCYAAEKGTFENKYHVEWKLSPQDKLYASKDLLSLKDTHMLFQSFCEKNHSPFNTFDCSEVDF